MTDRSAHHSPASPGSAPLRRPARTYEQHTDKSNACHRVAVLSRGTIIEAWTRNPARLLSRFCSTITEHFCDIWSVGSATARSQKTSCRTRLRRSSRDRTRRLRMKRSFPGSIATFETPPSISFGGAAQLTERTKHSRASSTPKTTPSTELEAEICACVSRLAATLKPEYAEALEAIEVAGTPVKTFAEQKGLSSSNAGVRVFRAREALKKRVTESCGTCAEHGCLNCTCKRA